MKRCTYPECSCPFDMGPDNKCLRGFESKNEKESTSKTEGGFMTHNIGELTIERAETGFVVYERAAMGQIGRKWAFEHPESLAEFIVGWAAKDDEPRNT